MRHYDDAGLTEVDYDHLPEALRRKYFSSLERLRLAHDGTCSNLTGLPSSRKPSTSNGRRSFQRSQSFSSTIDPQRALRRKPSTRRRLQKSKSQSLAQSRRPSTTASEFASLPPVIQRKQFSREEQILFASCVHEVILDAADEAVYRHQRHQSKPDNASPSYEASINSDIYGEADPLPQEPAEEMDPADLESFRWLDEDEDLDLSLDDYHAIIAATAAKQASLPRHSRSSFRRGISFSGTSFHRRSSSSTSNRSHLPGFPAFQQLSTLPRSGPVLRHQSKISTSSLDPAATHYQDPTARMKLRVYLASPQKFDEAIEFGFPSLQEHSSESPRPKTSPGQSEQTGRTFFNDDTPSLSADEDPDDRDEFRREDSPRTPETWAFPDHRPSHQSSSDRSFLRPPMLRGHTESVVPYDREMTLRMTLTRPDLRSPEDTYPSQPRINDTPLEHAPLTVPDQVQSIWDELPEEPSKVKRFFKKLWRT